MFLSSGVVRNIKTHQHTSKWNSATKSWCEDSRVVSSEWTSTAFHLESVGTWNNKNNNNDNNTDDNSSAQVHVKQVRGGANKLQLATVSENYTPTSKPGVLNRLGNYLNGESVVGVTTVESMLVLNTVCTVVGEYCCRCMLQR